MMIDLGDITLDVRDSTLDVRDSGTGPSVLLLHGWPYTNEQQRYRHAPVCKGRSGFDLAALSATAARRLSTEARGPGARPTYGWHGIAAATGADIHS